MDISSSLRDSLIELAKYYQLDLLILFGSRVKGKSSKKSDYDLAFLKKTISSNEELELIENLESLFKEEKFDFINLKTNDNPLLRKEIFFNGVCLYESEKFLFEKEKEIAYFDYVDSFELLQPSKDKFLSKAL